jgi:hypothetical protein
VMARQRGGGARRAANAPTKQSPEIAAHGLVELLSMVLPEGGGEGAGGVAFDEDCAGGNSTLTETTHAADGNRQRAFETVLASGFTAVSASMSRAVVQSRRGKTKEHCLPILTFSSSRYRDRSTVSHLGSR